MSFKQLKIATRNSKLALAQTKLVTDFLKTKFKKTEFVIIESSTIADKIIHKPLANIGGKALFTKQIDKFLYTGQADLAIHSAKDMEGIIDEKLFITTPLPRQEDHDVLINANDIDDLNQIYTASPRRKAQLLRLNPKLKIGLIRGNVITRIQKGKPTILAKAGLNRLNISKGADLNKQSFLPCAGQGIIAVTCINPTLYKAIKSIEDQDTKYCLTAERAVLKQINGDCQTALAVNSEIDGQYIKVKAAIYNFNGKYNATSCKRGLKISAERLGLEVGKVLKEKSKNFAR